MKQGDPSDTLRWVMREFGRKVYDEPRRLRAILFDVFHGVNRTVNVLVAAAEQGVARELDDSSNALPWEVVSARLIRRLVDDVAMQEGDALWAVETWARALGRDVPEPRDDRIKPQTQRPEERPASRAGPTGDNRKGQSLSRQNLDPGLSCFEVYVYAILFFFVPGACVFVSSILYYAWRKKQPRRASNVNALGWTIFLLQLLLLICLILLARFLEGWR